MGLFQYLVFLQNLNHYPNFKLLSFLCLIYFVSCQLSVLQKVQQICKNQFYSEGCHNYTSELSKFISGHTKYNPTKFQKCTILQTLISDR